MKEFNRMELEAKIVTTAWKDPQFKKKLLKNPKETIEMFIKTEYGKDFELPAELHYQVVEEHPNTFVLVLPPSPSDGSNLSEDDLEAILNKELA